MEYKVGILERLILLQALPGTGDLPFIRIVSDLQDELAFSEGELGDLQMKTVDGRMTWQPDAIPNKPIEIGPVGQEIFRKGLPLLIDQLHKAEQLSVSHVKLADLFDCDLSSIGKDEDDKPADDDLCEDG